MSWQWIIGTTDGSLVRAFTEATRLQLGINLDSADEASVTMSGFSKDAASLGDGWLDRDLFVYYDGDLLFRGRCWPPNDRIDPNEHQVDVTAREYRAVLERCHTTTDLHWTDVEQEEIAWEMIDAYQQLPGGDFGITRHGGATGVQRSRSFQAPVNVARRIDELADAGGGFDWAVLPDLSFRVWSHRGADQGRLLHYTENGGNVQTVQRTPDVTRFGTAVVGTATGALVPEVAEAAEHPVGRWSLQRRFDVDSATALEEQAAGLLDRSNRRSGWSFTLKPGLWRGPGWLWVGDTVGVAVRSGWLDVTTEARVVSMSFEVSADGGETVTVEVDRRALSLVDELGEDRRRISDLER